MIHFSYGYFFVLTDTQGHNDTTFSYIDMVFIGEVVLYSPKVD